MDWDNEKFVRKTFGLGILTVKNLGVFFSCNQIVVSKFSGKVRQNSESYKYLEHERFIFIWESDSC